MVGRTKDGNSELITDNNDTNFDFSSSQDISMKDYFMEYLFPDAILYGMSYDEFWNKDPQLFYSYRFSFIEKQRLKRMEDNFNAWLCGFYNVDAFSTTLYNAFRKESKKPKNYMLKPIDFEEMEKPIEEEETQQKTIHNKWGTLKSRLKGG